MKGDKRFISPIMTNSESIHQFGNNAYGKPATALNILRETVMGRELFDYAFKTYSQRWMFKHPTPADFFRTMEDASGVDLDWFWRGWFFTTDHCDIAIDDVKYFRLSSMDPEKEKAEAKAIRDASQENDFIGDERNLTDIKETKNEKDPGLNDFYITYDPLDVTELDKKRYDRYMSNLSDEEKKLLESDYHYYQIDFSNVGGLVMPVIVEFTYTDGTTEVHHIPAEIWATYNDAVSKVFILKKQVAAISLDPFLETADCDMSNNAWPKKYIPSKFELYKQRMGRKNPMQEAGEGN